jgi:hypothetical protein
MLLWKSCRGLNNIQKGSFGVAYSKMAFTLEGFEVYNSEYDDRGVDFVIQSKSSQFFLVQVKSTIDDNANPFIKKNKFQVSENFVFCVVRIIDGKEPILYIARGSDWKEKSKKCDCLHYNQKGGESGPYYEIRFASKYKNQLKNFEFQTYIKKLKTRSPR